jgi:putative endonuclease
MFKTEKQTIGEWGEQEAVRFLIEKGYEVIEKNFQTRQGEIDIIAKHIKIHFGETLCFVEVKTRSGEKGSAERATRGEKFGRIQKAAQAYCLEHGLDMNTVPIQFEQVSIYGGPKGLRDIRHYEIPMI